MKDGRYVFDDFRNHRLRLWINDPPPISFEAINSFLHILTPDSVQSDIPAISIVVELRKNLNANNYAWLGAKYTPSDHDTLRVEGLVGTPGGKVLKDHIALPNDKVRSGIPEQYALPIANVTLRHKYHAKCLPVGHLIFNQGAHAAAGSSPVMFANTTRLIYKLLTSNVSKLEREQLSAIIEEHLFI